ncbi:MAG: DMT family transporter [Ignavibacteria bacterium]|nr:DMT family transporter [Ignavibacteria bacterium]
MGSQRVRFIALAKATFAVVVWGASFIATKIALHEVSPVTVIWLRFGIGVAVLGVFVALRKELVSPSRRELGYFSLVGFQGITFHQWLQVTGLQTAKASTTGWIIATIPIFIALLAWLILKERLGWIQAIGIFIAAAGVLLVISEGDPASVISGHFGAPGDLLVFLSAPNWAVFSVISRQGLKKHPATLMMFYVMLFGWLLTTVWLGASGSVSEIGSLSLSGWWSILFLGVFCSGIAYIFWYDALRDVSASQVGSLLYLEPLVAVVVAFFLLHEPLFVALFLGGALILLGVWLVTRSTMSEGPPD